MRELLIGTSWRAAQLGRMRQDFEDFGAGAGGFDATVGTAADWQGAVDSGAFIETGVNTSGVSLSDQLRGADSLSVPWGTGQQDVIAGAPPGEQGTPSLAGSLSDRLRGIDAAGAVSDASQKTALLVGSQPYDPELSTGTMDWSTAFQSFVKAAVPLSQAVATTVSGFARLAGVGAPAAPRAGGVAPGGTPVPTFLQRLLGGGGATGTSSAPTLSQAGATGSLLMVGLVAGLGYLVLVKGR